jgi:hypothetical protein
MHRAGETDAARDARARAAMAQRLLDLHFVDDVEQRHEALRAALAAGEFDSLAAAMRPMRELAEPARVHAEICALTEGHFQDTISSGRSPGYGLTN